MLTTSGCLAAECAVKRLNGMDAMLLYSETPNLSEIYPAGPLPPGCGVNITVWSYVDHRTFNDTHELTDAVIHSFTEIRSASVLSGDLAGVPTAMPPANAG